MADQFTCEWCGEEFSFVDRDVFASARLDDICLDCSGAHACVMDPHFDDDHDRCPPCQARAERIAGVQAARLNVAWAEDMAPVLGIEVEG